MSNLLFVLLIVIIIISVSKCQKDCPIECVKGCYKVLHPIVQDYECTSKGRCTASTHFKEKFRVCSAFPYNKNLNINLKIFFNLNQFLDHNGRWKTAVCGFMNSPILTTTVLTTTLTADLTDPTDLITDSTDLIIDLTDSTDLITDFTINFQTEVITEFTTEIATKLTTEISIQVIPESYKFQYISAEIALSVGFGFLCFVLLSIYLLFKRLRVVTPNSENGIENGIEMVSLSSPLMEADISVTLNSTTMKIEKVATKYIVSNV